MVDVSSWPVALYVPNLIGYVRVATGLLSFAYALDPASLWIFFLLYGFSYALDAVDGVAARQLNQKSTFGALLDMVTDRFCTAGLLAVLATLNKDINAYFVAFIVLMILDVVSHWAQMFSTLTSGAESHKTLKDEHPILRFYYAFPYALFVVCALNELCLASMFLDAHFRHGGSQDAWLQTTVAGVIGSGAASTVFGAGVAKMPAHVFVLYATFPVFAFKQICSVVQLATAVQRVIAIDEDKKKRKA